MGRCSAKRTCQEQQGRKPILRVVVVDGHPVTREGQRALLSAEVDMQIVGEAETGEEALRLVTEVSPDLMILDLNVEGNPSGIELCRRIKALPDAPYILVFTDYDLAEEMASRSSAETNGYLHKRCDSSELLETMRRVAAGEKVWEARERLGVRGSRIPAALLEDAHLTPRELEVLAIKLRRRTNAEIADALHISLNTVKHHVTSIYRKLEKTRKDLLGL